MPLFKTKYNDVDKAVKALKNGKSYDINKANLKVLDDNSRLFFESCIDRFGAEILNWVVESQYRSDLFAYAVEKLGVEILDRAGNWVYNDWSVMGAAYKKDETIIERMTPEVRYRFCPPEERLYWFFKQIETKPTILLRRGDSVRYAYIQDGNNEFREVLDVSTLNKYNAFAYMIGSTTWHFKGMIFDKKSNMVIFGLGFGNAIFFSVDEFLKDNNNKIADLINLSFPKELIGRLEEVKHFNFDNWFQPKHETKIFDQEYLKNIIIPFVDNLLLGKKIRISELGENKDLFSKIIQGGLSSLPADKANSYSFSTDIGPDKYFDSVRIQIARRKDVEKSDNNIFILNAEKGCENYIPQTDYAKQMLAKLSKNEGRQSVEEVVEQSSSEHKKSDHELS